MTSVGTYAVVQYVNAMHEVVNTNLCMFLPQQWELLSWLLHMSVKNLSSTSLKRDEKSLP